MSNTNEIPPMPVHDGSRSDQDEGFLPTGPARSQRNPEQLVKDRELMAKSWCMQGQQLLTEGQIFKDEVLAGPESADDPPKEMSEPHDHGKKFSGKVRLQLAPSRSFCGCTTIWRETAIQFLTDVRNQEFRPKTVTPGRD